jgi:hypothetical protein
VLFWLFHAHPGWFSGVGERGGANGCTVARNKYVWYVEMRRHARIEREPCACTTRALKRGRIEIELKMRCDVDGGPVQIAVVKVQIDELAALLRIGG